MKASFQIKILLLLTTVINSFYAECQKEGQSFCEGYYEGDYFPLDIEKKKLIWYDTYYYEVRVDSVTIGNSNYHIFEQRWENGQVDSLYLKSEQGQVSECLNIHQSDSPIIHLTRYSPDFPIGHTWTREYGFFVKYVIKSYAGTLKTPYCEYNDLLVISAFYDNISFDFYYLKGYGYVGATHSDSSIPISWTSPQWSEE